LGWGKRKREKREGGRRSRKRLTPYVREVKKEMRVDSLV
jgi:hypothetical protein